MQDPAVVTGVSVVPEVPEVPGVPGVIDRRYVLHELLGEGGMGTVYRATHHVSGRAVALKLVRETRPQSEDEAEAEDVTRGSLGTPKDRDLRLALTREFQTLASLHHPNIVRVLDYGFDAARGPYLTMELLPAPRSIVEAGIGTAQTLQLEWLAQLLRALAYLHRRGVIHRDIKPSSSAIEGEQVSNI